MVMMMHSPRLAVRFSDDDSTTYFVDSYQEALTKFKRGYGHESGTVMTIHKAQHRKQPNGKPYADEVLASWIRFTNEWQRNG